MSTPILGSQDQEIQNTRDTTPLTSVENQPKGIKISVVEKHYKKGNVNSIYKSASPQINKNTSIINSLRQKTKRESRKDYFGTEINKKNKRRVKLVFVDEVTDQSLLDVVEIESIKEYNKVPLLDGGKDLYIKETTCCSCFIF